MGHKRLDGGLPYSENSILAWFNKSSYRNILQGSRGKLTHPSLFKDNSVSGHSALAKWVETSLLCWLPILRIVRPLCNTSQTQGLRLWKNKARAALLDLGAVRKCVSLKQPLERNGSLAIPRRLRQVNQRLQLFLFAGLLLNQFLVHFVHFSVQICFA